MFLKDSVGNVNLERSQQMTQKTKKVPSMQRVNKVFAKLGEAMSSYSLSLSALTILPAKSDSDVMFCLQSYQQFITDKSLVY